MEKLGDRSWKSYYRAERESRKEELVRRMEEQWTQEDEEVTIFLKEGGLLSFPHTYLDQSMEPLLRTVKAIYSSNKRKVVALGVLHNSIKVTGIEDEFCLDGFKYMLDLAAERFGLPAIEVEELFITRDKDLDPMDIRGIIDRLVARGKMIGSELGPDTALVITGDLSHYGHGYQTEDIVRDPSSLIVEQWSLSLDLLYKKKDMTSFIPQARMCMNDQVFVGIAASAALGDDLEYKVFSQGLADYSSVLETERPTVVASVFYGVKRRG